MPRSTPSSTEAGKPRDAAGTGRRGPRSLLALLAASLLLSSCLGLEANATIAPGGEGRLKLDYVVPFLVASFDSLEGRERLLPLPLTREGAEKVIAVSPGLSLLSFSRKEGETEANISLEIEFASPAALSGLLQDQAGDYLSYIEEDGERRLSLVPTRGRGELDPGLSGLIDAAFAPYRVSLRLNLPSAAKRIKGGTAKGTEVAWTASTVELLKSREAVTWEAVW